MVLGLGAIAAPLAAQVSTFDLGGVIKDAQGGVLPGVTVTMRNEKHGPHAHGGRAIRTACTYFANLPPQGTWELSTELPGSRRRRRASSSSTPTASRS